MSALLGYQVCLAKGYARIVGPAVDRLVQPPLLSVQDAQLVPPQCSALRESRDGAQPGSAHVTLLNRDELAAAAAAGAGAGLAPFVARVESLLAIDPPLSLGLGRARAHGAEAYFVPLLWPAGQLVRASVQVRIPFLPIVPPFLAFKSWACRDRNQHHSD